MVVNWNTICATDDLQHCGMKTQVQEVECSDHCQMVGMNAETEFWLVVVTPPLTWI
jgi:hypothetical protein